jgi:hypothetical protein
MSGFAPECDSDDESVFVDIDELVEAHPHPLQDFHLVCHEPDRSLKATPLALP